MSSKRAEQLLANAASKDGQAVDPIMIGLALQVITQIVQFCRNRGTDTQTVAKSLKSPSAHFRKKFRDGLEDKLGKRKYKQLGGRAYAAKLMNAGLEAREAECVAFVEEVTLEHCS